MSIMGYLTRKGAKTQLSVDGAALFYTTPVPANLQVLRQYALHLLFMPPAPSPGMVTSTEVQAPVRKIFPFSHKPNTLDRDRIVVPAGWDSWGKIAVLRDGFDAKMWGEAWERDLEADESSGESGAKRAYANLVPDQGSKVSVCLFHIDSEGTDITDIVTTSTPIQQPDTRTGFPCQKLRREFQEVRPRSSGCVQKSARWCSCGNCRSIGEQQLQPAERRTRSERHGIYGWACWRGRRARVTSQPPWSSWRNWARGCLRPTCELIAIGHFFTDGDAIACFTVTCQRSESRKCERWRCRRTEPTRGAAAFLPEFAEHERPHSSSTTDS